MKIIKKMLSVLIALSLSCSLLAVNAFAADKGEYTYTVTLYAGNQGAFTPDIQLFVDHTKSGNTRESEVRTESGIVTVSNLARNDIVTVELQAGGLELHENSRYYVKGIRKSGRDNNTVATSIFRVDRDDDYVVAYGVQGDMVAYTVNYQDAAGNELIPSNTYYGNVGDKPVVAYRYIEGYEPQDLALTKTLVTNEAENVFTFVYSPADGGGGGGGGGVVTRVVGTPGTTTTTVTEVIPGTVTTTTTTTTETGGGGGGAAAADDAAAAAADDAGAAAADEAAAAGDETPLTQIGDEEVPLADQDLKDLDEEEVPASDIQLDTVVKKGLPLAACIGIAAAAAAALGVLLVFLKKRKGKKGDAI